MMLKVQVTDGPHLTRTIALEGRLDFGSVGVLDTELDSLLEKPVKVLVFDLSKLEYISSAGLRSLFRAQKSVKAQSGKVVLLNPTPPVQKVLEIVEDSGVGDIFSIVEELDQNLDPTRKKVSEGE
ncbi:MAG TPA: STAS domain-containing protein [Vicinamibacteria bacterium]|nr:STAS domain-containing protein [Vicinamibacteria bacterium]